MHIRNILARAYGDGYDFRADDERSQLDQARLELDRLETAERELAALRAPVGDAEAWGRVLADVFASVAASPSFWASVASALLSRYHAALVAAATEEMGPQRRQTAHEWQEELLSILEAARALVAPGRVEPSIALRTHDQLTELVEKYKVASEEQNRADAAEAEVKRLRAELEETKTECNRLRVAGQMLRQTAGLEPGAILGDGYEETEAAIKRLRAENETLHTCNANQERMIESRDAEIYKLHGQLSDLANVLGVEYDSDNVDTAPAMVTAAKSGVAAEAEVKRLRAELAQVEIVKSAYAATVVAHEASALPVTVEAMREAYLSAYRPQSDASPCHDAGLTAVARLVVAAIRAGGAALTARECSTNFDRLAARETSYDEDSRDFGAWHLNAAIERAGLVERDTKPARDLTYANLEARVVALEGFTTALCQLTDALCQLLSKGPYGA